jgi:hypothetical protein
LAKSTTNQVEKQKLEALKLQINNQAAKLGKKIWRIRWEAKSSAATIAA